MESAAFPNLIEKVCRGISLEHPAAECVLNAAGATVGDDVVSQPILPSFFCGLLFIFAVQFLITPESVVDSIESARGVELPKLSFIARIIRLENTIPDIVAAGPAHGKDFLSSDLVKLSLQQVQDVGTDRLHQIVVLLTRRMTAE